MESDDGTCIAGEDPVSVLAVKELVDLAAAAWKPFLRIERGQLPPAQIFLVPAPAEEASDNFASLTLEWSTATSRERVIEAIADLALNRHRILNPESGVPASWVREFLCSILTCALDDSHEAILLAAAEDPPARLENLLGQSCGDTQYVAQGWLLGQWWAGLRTLDPALADALWRGNYPVIDREVEAAWAAYSLQKRTELRGPFLSLAESAKQIRTLGRIHAWQGGQERILWVFELPPDQQARPETQLAERRGQLQAIESRIHPLYHASLVALIGSLCDEAGAASFREAFWVAWDEAVKTAAEIETILSTPDQP